MERIYVKEIKRVGTAKGDMLVLQINGNRKVSVPAWLKQEISFVENDVGLGGSFECNVVKNGDYLNVADVNFSSAQKGSYEKLPDTPIIPRDNGSVLSVRDNIIVAQVILKEANNIVSASLAGGLEMSFEDDSYEKWLVENVQALTKAYKVALSELEK